MYQRKTRDRWDIMTNWGYGWECECSEYTRAEAIKTFKEYKANSCGRYDVMVERHMEKIKEANI